MSLLLKKQESSGLKRRCRIEAWSVPVEITELRHGWDSPPRSIPVVDDSTQYLESGVIGFVDTTSVVICLR